MWGGGLPGHVGGGYGLSAEERSAITMIGFIPGLYKQELDFHAHHKSDVVEGTTEWYHRDSTSKQILLGWGFEPMLTARDRDR
jgi:hypothetical protein